MNSFWEISKKDLEDKKAELRNKDREMEELEERHQVEIKVYKQKVKHLLYEHQNNVTTLKADGEMALKLQQDEFAKREEELQYAPPPLLLGSTPHAPRTERPKVSTWWWRFLRCLSHIHAPRTPLALTIAYRRGRDGDGQRGTQTRTALL